MNNGLGTLLSQEGLLVTHYTYTASNQCILIGDFVKNSFTICNSWDMDYFFMIIYYAYIRTEMFSIKITLTNTIVKSNPLFLQWSEQNFQRISC